MSDMRALIEAVQRLGQRWGYCTDCEKDVPMQDDGRGMCGHGRVVFRPSATDDILAALRAKLAEGAE